jgi:hypothetical protein
MWGGGDEHGIKFNTRLCTTSLVENIDVATIQVSPIKKRKN